MSKEAVTRALDALAAEFDAKREGRPSANAPQTDLPTAPEPTETERRQQQEWDLVRKNGGRL